MSDPTLIVNPGPPPVAALVERPTLAGLFDQRFVVAVLTIVIVAVYDFAVTFFHPVIEKELLTVMITALNANGLIVAIQYYLGSSKGSTDKNPPIKQLSG